MKKVNLFLPFLAICLFCLNCTEAQVRGQGSTVTETINMSKITAIGLGISANVYVKSGSSQKIEIIGQANIIDLLNKEPRGESWSIKFKKGTKVKNYDKLEIHVTLTELEALSIGGSGNIVCEGTFKSDDVALSIGGSGNIKLSIDADDLACSIGGSGDMELSGNADDIRISIAGSGDINAFDLKVESCSVSTAGSGDVEISVSSKLDVSLVGSGDVTYKGSPKVKKTIVGSGDVEAH